jgi:hypothetical protein
VAVWNTGTGVVEKPAGWNLRIDEINIKPEKVLAFLGC